MFIVLGMYNFDNIPNLEIITTTILYLWSGCDNKKAGAEAGELLELLLFCCYKLFLDKSLLI